MEPNVTYKDLGNGTIEGTLYNGIHFIVDKEDFPKIKDKILYPSKKNSNGNQLYIMSKDRKYLHTFIIDCPKGFEVDHINRNTMDNRKSNLRIVTHRQNQCNQDLQRNNTSGVSGVSYYPPKKKYRARIKVQHHDLHLGYFKTFEEAVQARNEGMKHLFGEYGVYNDVPPAPKWISDQVAQKCRPFLHLAA